MTATGRKPRATRRLLGATVQLLFELPVVAGMVLAFGLMFYAVEAGERHGYVSEAVAGAGKLVAALSFVLIPGAYLARVVVVQVRSILPSPGTPAE